MNEIKVFKLLNGDEIIAEVVKQGPNWTIKKIRMVLMQQTQQGIGLGLLPWLATNINDEFELFPTSLMGVPFEPEENLKKEYLQQTTGIAIPK